MAHRNQIEFIKQNRELIREPILLIGSKMYDFDQYDLADELKKLGFSNITGTDIDAGPGVDIVVDITDQHSAFMLSNRSKFATVVCMEVLTHIKNPFLASENIAMLSAPSGIVILSDVFVRKLSHMPYDFWRFSLEGLKVLFDKFEFYNDRSRYSITRQKDGKLKPFPGKFEAIMKDEKHENETAFGFLIRRIHRKFFSSGVFRISRLMPEQSVYAIGKLRTP